MAGRSSLSAPGPGPGTATAAPAPGGLQQAPAEDSTVLMLMGIMLDCLGAGSLEAGLFGEGLRRAANAADILCGRLERCGGWGHVWWARGAHARMCACAHAPSQPGACPEAPPCRLHTATRPTFMGPHKAWQGSAAAPAHCIVIPWGRGLPQLQYLQACMHACMHGTLHAVACPARLPSFDTPAVLPSPPLAGHPAAAMHNTWRACQEVLGRRAGRAPLATRAAPLCSCRC